VIEVEIKDLLLAETRLDAAREDDLFYLALDGALGAEVGLGDLLRDCDSRAWPWRTDPARRLATAARAMRENRPAMGLERAVLGGQKRLDQLWRDLLDADQVAQVVGPDGEGLVRPRAEAGLQRVA